MFCENCGIKLEEGAQFCQNCGKKPGVVSDNPSPSTTSNVIAEGDDIFYSEDWRRAKVFAIASLPYFDLMIDKRYLYIIQIPKYSNATLGLILGLLIFNIFGAIIGSIIGSSSDAKKRKHYRSAWVDSEHKLISNDYNNDIFLKVPLESLKSCITIGKGKFTLLYAEKEIVLQKGQKEFDQFNKYIEKYVL